MEELLALKKADLQKLADEKGITYTSRMTNPELAELIYAHNEKTEQDENAQNASVSAEVAQTHAGTGGAVPPVGNGWFIVPNQRIKVQIRQENGDLVESDAPLDDFIGFDHVLSSDDASVLSIDYESLASDDSFMIVAGQTLKVVTKQDGELIEGFIDANIIIDGSGQRIIQLEQEKADLKKINEALDAANNSLEVENDKLAVKVVQGLGLVADKVVTNDVLDAIGSAGHNAKGIIPPIHVRVRVVPNKGLTSRIRAGMQFGVQYSEHEIDKATFDVLVADSHLQVEALDG